MNIESMNESYAMAFLVTEYNTRGRFCADVIESYCYENTKWQHILDKTIIRIFLCFSFNFSLACCTWVYKIVLYQIIILLYQKRLLHCWLILSKVFCLQLYRFVFAHKLLKDFNTIQSTYSRMYLSKVLNSLAVVQHIFSGT